MCWVCASLDPTYVRAYPGAMPTQRQKSPPRLAPPGLAARSLAHDLIAGVLIDRRPLDQLLAESLAGVRPAGSDPIRAIEPRDRAFARLLAATVLRRLGELEL